MPVLTWPTSGDLECAPFGDSREGWAGEHFRWVWKLLNITVKYSTSIYPASSFWCHHHGGVESLAQSTQYSFSSEVCVQPPSDTPLEAKHCFSWSDPCMDLNNDQPADRGHLHYGFLKLKYVYSVVIWDDLAKWRSLSSLSSVRRNSRKPQHIRNT